MSILPRVPGLPPRTKISPEFKRFRPTIHDKRVVLPHPEAPSKPYLEKINKINKETRNSNLR
jgi:hypothetical protein